MKYVIGATITGSGNKAPETKTFKKRCYMLVILEIILTIWVWRKGWGAKALIPSVAVFGFAFIMGMFIGVANGNIDTVRPLFFLLDLGLIGVLSYMIAKPPITDVVPEIVKEEETFKLD